MRERGRCERDASYDRAALEKEIQFTDRQRNRILAILAPEPGESATLEAFRIDTEAGAIPVQRLRAHPIAADEDIDIPIERIAMHALRHQGTEPIKSLPHIRRTRVRVDGDASAMPSHRHSLRSCAA